MSLKDKFNLLQKIIWKIHTRLFRDECFLNFFEDILYEVQSSCKMGLIIQSFFSYTMSII